MNDTRDPYAQDGVNVPEGDKFSRYAAGLCQDSYGNSPYAEILVEFGGNFRGIRPFRIRADSIPILGECVIDTETDGLGTKSILSSASGVPTGAAHDLFAMTAGDITRNGGVPFMLDNLLDVSSLGESGGEVNAGYREMLAELAEIADDQRVVLHKGETAEIGPCVGSDDPYAMWKFNWGGTAYGLFHRELMITGEGLRPGLSVIALKENGFRCNGISSVRSALRKNFGKEWWADISAESAIENAARPSVIYDRLLAEANGWRDHGIDIHGRIPMHAICHVTGGALKSKLGQDLLFPRGLSAVLDDLYEPPLIMKSCAMWRGLSDEQAYGIWNGGQGALVVVDEESTGPFIELAESHGIDARICGLITKQDTPSLTVVSKFGSGEVITYS